MREEGEQGGGARDQRSEDHGRQGAQAQGADRLYQDWLDHLLRTGAAQGTGAAGEGGRRSGISSNSMEKRGQRDREWPQGERTERP